MKHELKTWPQFFEAILDGRKNFEFRRNDRDFRVGDLLDLKEWDPATKAYTGRACEVRITYILSDEWPGMEKGFTILSIDRARSMLARIIENEVERQRKNGRERTAVELQKIAGHFGGVNGI
jgi:hypothetical protein